jgi:hypothetical protein
MEEYSALRQDPKRIASASHATTLLQVHIHATWFVSGTQGHNNKPLKHDKSSFAENGRRASMAHSKVIAKIDVLVIDSLRPFTFVRSLLQIASKTWQGRRECGV